MRNSSRKRILVTGGAGFIGSNFIRWLLSYQRDVQVINLDALTYAGNLESLEDVVHAHGPDGDGRYSFIHGDVRDVELLREVLHDSAPDCVIHMAAESHVDRSIMGPSVFVDTNIRGTLTLLESCRAELAESRRVRASAAEARKRSSTACLCAWSCRPTAMPASGATTQAL